MDERQPRIEWFEDLALGMRFKSAGKLITREDIKRFAAEFDPQPFHLDEAAAERTPLKGLAASGWHTCCIFMRMLCDAFLLDSTSPPGDKADRSRSGRLRPGPELASPGRP